MKDKERQVAFAGLWINMSWTEEEKRERRELYAMYGIDVFKEG